MASNAPVTKLDLPGIIQLGMDFGSAKVLLTANELHLFTVLDEHGPATEPQVRELLGLHPRGSREFLNALVKLGLLHRDEGRYRNTPAADTYLVKGRPAYVGRFLDRSSSVLYGAWGGFTESLRTGESQIEGHGNDNMFKHLYRNEEQMRDFVAMMDALNSAVGPVLAEAFDWSDRTTVVDIGGARGNLAAGLVKAHPHLRATVFDLPPVEAAFRDHIGELGLTDRITFQGGDFFADPLPTADVVIFGHVLEDWSAERRQQLISKAYEALRPGGVVLVYDPMLDDELSPLNNLLTSLTMLVVTHGGSEYTVDACRGWMRTAGFARSEAKVLETNDILVAGHKA
ncbi:methyltransferase [Actinoplanes sp. RD1]|uniref:methyltransferase n=1 Tax=Actinoplanes sp. RD1 TaxID=3064538 RepID=UPI0027413EAF|nr:methyltransferase [Actinoplanes sp. RD1]